jgi:hypothetical protein
MDPRPLAAIAGRQARELKNIPPADKSIYCLPVSKQQVRVKETGQQELADEPPLFGLVDCNKRRRRNYGFFMHS